MSDEQPVTLTSLAGGAAIELFDEELSRVVSNILDPNIEAETLREIVLRVQIKPDKDRGFGFVKVIATSKLGPGRGVGTTFFFGKRAGQCFAVENNPRQPNLFESKNVRAVNFDTGEAIDDK